MLLVEAGPDHADITTLPADVLDASQPTFDHDWGYAADEELDRGIQVPRARIMGGCSATNACFAQRGAPQDYDGWVAHGQPRLELRRRPRRFSTPKRRLDLPSSRWYVCHGHESSRGAVTDARGSVHGIEGLTVADASIMPTVPTDTPNLPVIMVAEHIAQWLRDT